MKYLAIFFTCFAVAFLGKMLFSREEPMEPAAADSYRCLPCGRDCDNKAYDKAGTCASCAMELVKKSTVVFKNIPASQICDYIKTHPTAILLDVRTKEEFEGKASPNFGGLKNAINVPIQELDSRMSSLSSRFKNKEVLVFCSHSHRSPQASYMLTQNGFTNVTNMLGGMSVVTDNSCKK
jgi:rhodanese-related sulfurtransferase/DNA-directed RNA polymerase subunit RPC12/RpoP